ncbi:MAG TPA: SDR family oxidoreductase [Candidatus Thermoplasmatota archaeon]|nr:SDR family oxidoreductase [Candidatus Thermoplasmatota archaeon]
MKALVTGGAGFIGSNLAERLLADGHQVHVLDDLSTGHRRNVPAKATFHHGSILDDALLRRAMAGAEVVFHQAALGSVPRSIAEPVTSHEVNLTGTVRVLEAARALEVRKVVFAASSSAYGDTPTLPKHEAMLPAPLSPYAVTKLAAEHYLAAYHKVYGLPTTSLRYFNVYGPRQDPNGAYAAVIPKFILSALRGEPLAIHGDGTQSRDFTYVADVVNANLLAAQSAKADGQVCNIGAAGRTDLNGLARDIVALAGSRSPIEHGPPRPGDVHDSQASLERARDLLGYRPAVALPEGLRRTVAWFRENAA